MHALANVVSVDVLGGPPADRAALALNTVLPDDVAVTTVEEAPDDFNARFDARSRSYRFRIWRRRERSVFEARRSLWWPRPDRPRRVERERRECCSASTTSARSRPPRRSTAASCGRCSAVQWVELGEAVRRVRDHRQLVPAAHGANAGRLDARGPRPRRRCSRDARAARPAPQRRHTACTSRTCPIADTTGV